VGGGRAPGVKDGAVLAGGGCGPCAVHTVAEVAAAIFCLDRALAYEAALV